MWSLTSLLGLPRSAHDDDETFTAIHALFVRHGLLFFRVTMFLPIHELQLSSNLRGGHHPSRPLPGLSELRIRVLTLQPNTPSLASIRRKADKPRVGGSI